MGPGAEGEEVVCLQLVGCRRPEALVLLLGLMSVSAQKPAPPNMQCLAKLDKTVCSAHTEAWIVVGLLGLKLRCGSEAPEEG